MNTALIMVAFAAAGISNLQSSLDRMRAAQDIPGVSAVVTRHDTIVFAGASGYADLESKRFMTPDTVLYAGSVSKVLTAVLVLQLVANGKLSLHDKVIGIADDSIEIRHLLTHASGLDREGNFDYWFNASFPDSAALARYLLNVNLRTAPGKAVRYSNIGYAALGPVIESTSGEDFQTALSKRVLDPLDMLASGTGAPGAGLSAGYSPNNRVLPNEKRPFAGLGRPVGNRFVREYHNAGAMTPAFGAYTTSRDLSKLARFLLGYGGDEVLPADMRSRMLTAQTGGRGFGIRLEKYKGRQVARHGGWFAAHQSHLLLDLQSGFTVVVQANSDSASPDRIAEALLDRALETVADE
jgi:CubicO group peptidase (beta-lactamase class C family)